MEMEDFDNNEELKENENNLSIFIRQGSLFDDEEIYEDLNQNNVMERSENNPNRFLSLLNTSNYGFEHINFLDQLPYTNQIIERDQDLKNYYYYDSIFGFFPRENQFFNQGIVDDQ